jgi:hypothetical protein
MYLYVSETNNQQPFYFSLNIAFNTFKKYQGWLLQTNSTMVFEGRTKEVQQKKYAQLA